MNWAFADEMMKLSARGTSGLAKLHNSKKLSNKEKWQLVDRHLGDHNYRTSLAKGQKDKKLRRYLGSMGMLLAQKDKGKGTEVPSQTVPGTNYKIIYLPGQRRWGCTCPDWKFRGATNKKYACKHIKAARVKGILKR